jgi:AsmA protein
MRKNILIAGCAVVAVFVVVVLGLSVFVDANQFRPTLEQKMAAALGRPVTVGHIGLSLLSGSVSVEDVSIADDPAFGSAPFLKAKAVRVGVDLMPLIFSRTLHVRSFALEAPQVVLLHSPSGKWNFSSLGVSSPVAGEATASGSAGQQSSSSASVSVAKLTMTKGQITVDTPGSRGKNRVYEDVNMEATDLSYTSAFPFRVRAKTPGDGTLNLEGKAGPLNGSDVAATPLQATVEMKHLDLAATGILDPASGIGGLVDLSATLASDGRQATAKGTLRANKLQLVQGSSPAHVPIEIDYESEYDLKNQGGIVKQGDVHVGKALARLTGNYNTRGDVPAVQMKLSGRQMPVSELEASLPAIGMTLPAGASLEAGTLDTDLTIDGPIDRLVTNGPINVSNAKLTGFDLASKMGSVASFAGLAKSADTLIQTLKANFRVAPNGIQADSIALLVPAVGSLTGNGTIAPKGAMHFTMVAKVNSANAVVGTASRVTSLGHPENGTPFLIEGTTTNPVFRPDVSTAVRSLVDTPDGVKATTGLLGGLLGKKKK